MKRYLLSAARLAMVFGVALVVLLSGCVNPFAPLAGSDSAATAADGPAAGTGSLTLNFGGSGGLSGSTVMPTVPLSSSIQSLQISLTRSGYAGVQQTVAAGTSSVTFPSLAVGVWNLEVLGRDTNALTIAAFTATVPIVQGAGNSIIVELRGSQSGAPATISYTLTWPTESVDSVQVYFFAAPYSTSWGTPLTVGVDYTLQASGANTTLLFQGTKPSGNYFLVTVLTRAGSNNSPVIEAVQLYDHQLSSKTVTLSSGQLTQPPSAPTGLVLTQPAGGQVLVSWTDTSSTELGFRVYRTVAGVQTLAGTTAPSATTFTDTGFTAGESITYAVRSFNDFGESITEATLPPVVPIGPFALTGPTNGLTGTTPTPVLAWTPAIGATSYTVTLVGFATVPGLTVGQYPVPAGTIPMNQFVQWHVTATNGSFAVQSPTWSFTTRGPQLYVATTLNASDTNPGSAELPFATLAAAAANAIAGDVIRMTGGSYNETAEIILTQNVTIEGHFNSTFTAQDPNNTRTWITGFGPLNTISVGANVTLRNLQVDNATFGGRTAIVVNNGGSALLELMEVSGGSTTAGEAAAIKVLGSGNLTVRSSTVRAAESAQVTNAYGVLIDTGATGTVTIGGNIAAQGNSFVATAGTGRLHGVLVQPGAAATVVVRNNTFLSSIVGGEPADTIRSDSSGVVLFVEDNQIWGNSTGVVPSFGTGAITVTAANNVTVRRNTIRMLAGTHGPQLGVYIGGTSNGALISDNRIEMGTTGSTSGLINFGIVLNSQSDVFNNVVVQSGTGTMGGSFRGIESNVDFVRILHNTVVNANPNLAAILVRWNAAAGWSSVVTNNLLIGGSPASDYGFFLVGGAMAPAVVHNNVFSNTLVWNIGDTTLAGLNAQTYGSANTSLNPMLNAADWYAPTGATPAALAETGSTAYTGVVNTDILGVARTVPITSGAYEIPPAQYLAARWDFQPGSELVDSSGNGVSLSIDTPGAFGLLSPLQYLEFNGTGVRYTAGPAPAVNSVVGGQTVAFYLRDKPLGQGSLVSMFLGATQVWAVGATLSSQLNVTHAGGYIGGTAMDYGLDLQTSWWNHVTVSFNTATGVASVYINGVFKGSGAFNATNFGQATTLYLGNSPDGSNAGNSLSGARIADVRIYNFAVSAEQALTLASGGNL